MFGLHFCEDKMLRRNSTVAAGQLCVTAALILTAAGACPMAAQTTPVTTIDGVVLLSQPVSAGRGSTAGFPIVINQPGSYKLATNLTNIPLNVDAIDIRANNVTFDLNGHAITGPGATGNNASGIAGIFLMPPVFFHSVVLNGSVSGFKFGLNLGPYSVYRDLFVSGNYVGIEGGPNSIVLRNIAQGNVVEGLELNTGSVVRENVATGNLVGMDIPCPSSVVGNAAYGNRSSELILDGTCTAAQNWPAP